jgi:5'-3' exonuclease
MKINKPKVNSLLIDGENLLKIGFHGTKNTQTENGSVGAIFHFINTIKRFYSEYGITKVVVFWEGENSKKYRQGYYPYYKQNRNSQYTEEQIYDLGRQRIRIKQYLEELYIRQVEVAECEADDGIAYYCKNSPNEIKLILSSDKDLLQLISEDVKIYLLNKKVVITDKNFHTYFDYHQGNVGLIKMIAGDSSDNISGLQNIGEEKTLKLFPELRKEKKDSDWIIERTNELLCEKPDNNMLKTIIEGKTKWGTYGNDYFAVMNKIINLEAPNVTDELMETISIMVNDPMDPEGRGGINSVMKMIKEDGIINYIPSYDDQYFVFWSTFITIIKKEQNYFKTKKI